MTIDDKKNEPVPNVSGTFQISEDTRVKELNDKDLMEKYGLDEETLIYARQFMED